MVTFDDLLDRVETYIHKKDDLILIKKAYDYACEKHQSQVRKSGEPYIIHPLEVAIILTDLHVGPNTLCAGLLHDVVEDTDTNVEEVSELFGDDIASMVEGLTKVSKLVFSSLEKAQVVNHQKMLIAMAQDIRVIVIKLADRLHNIRTLDAMKPEKRYRIAMETLEIYAPLAHRLGIFKIKAELEDRALRYTDFENYRKITNYLISEKQTRVNTIETMIAEINDILKKQGIVEYRIKGRIKNIYSIYKKMISQHKDFEDIYDIVAVRIIVKKIEDCYRILGLIHANYTPIPKRFKDYIAVPKPNMYQSLHTTVIAGNGLTFEVQIRTEEMDQIAELGIAAHWAYKENASYSKDKEQYEIAQKLKWYGELLQLAKEEKDDAESLVETVKADIFDANVYVYTPQGAVIDLPKGSTPLDFAYKIHTNIGNETVGAIVNGKIVPLTYELKTADIVKINTNKNSSGPSVDWLKIVKTNHAKNKIKTFLNKQNRELLVESGKDQVKREFEAQKIFEYDLTDKFALEFFGKNNIESLEDLYNEIGKGNISSKTVVSKYLGTTVDKEQLLQKQLEKSQRILTTNSETGVVVLGLTNPLIKLASCCNPIPGDEIYGYVSKSNGIVVHADSCPNLKALDQARVMKLEWASNIKRKYPVNIIIISEQYNTVLAEVIATITQQGLHLAEISCVNTPKLESVIKAKIVLSNKEELDRICANLNKIAHVHIVERDYN